jgi:hypothetical protein
MRGWRTDTVLSVGTESLLLLKRMQVFRVITALFCELLHWCLVHCDEAAGQDVGRFRISGSHPARVFSGVQMYPALSFSLNYCCQ